MYDENKVLKQVSNFAANNVRDTDLTLTWSKPQAEKQIEKNKEFDKAYSYRVTIKTADNRIAKYDDITVPSDQNQVSSYFVVVEVTVFDIFALSLLATYESNEGFFSAFWQKLDF